MNNNIVKNITISNLIVTFSLLISLGVTIWQGMYSLDPHHWGLMLSNAKDLFDGKQPYKDIFIQYGLGTTIIQAISYGIYKNLLSIIIISALFYFLGLGIFYKICILVTKDKKLSFYIFFTLLIIHPIVIYPWSNYISYPFILMGIYYLIINPQNLNKFFLGGLNFGLAILIREGLAPALIAIIISFSLIDIYLSKNLSKTFKKLCVTLVACFIPIIIFLIYLKYNDLYNYWLIYAWELPKIYIKWWPHMTGLNIFNKLFEVIWKNSLKLNITWMILGFSLLCAFGEFVYFIIRPQLDRQLQAKIAFSSMVLTLSALHSPEIFRIATGSGIAILVMYQLLNKLKLQTFFFIFIVFFLLKNILNINSGNPFFPVVEVRLNAVKMNNLPLFNNQRWNLNVKEYYENIFKDLFELKKLNCGIDFHQNQTKDVFLHILSPFKNYSMSPFIPSEDWLILRPDIRPFEEKLIDRDILIFQMFPISELGRITPPPGYIVYGNYPVPEMVFIPSQSFLTLLVPEKCAFLSSRPKFNQE